MGSVLNYIGKKSIDLQEYEIDKYSVYVEPFSGSFNTGFTLMEQGYKGKVIYNDLDEQLINFWTMLRSNPLELYRLCIELFNNVKETNKIEEQEQNTDKLTQASEFYIRQLFNTMNGLNFSKRKNIPSFEQYDFIINSEMLNRITIEQLDFAECIEKYDSIDTFFLIDPPYIRKTSSNYYNIDFQQLSYDKLIDTIDNIQGQWLLTYNDNYNLRQHYKNIKEIKRKLYGREYTELYIRKF